MGAILFGPISIVELVADSANGIADLSAFRRIGKRFKHLSVLRLLGDSLRDAASRTAPITFPADLHHETQEKCVSSNTSK